MWIILSSMIYLHDAQNFQYIIVSFQKKLEATRLSQYKIEFK